VGDVQHTEANALVAVMMAVSMLRELREEHGEVTRELATRGSR
jgi:hypothetical protein